MKNLLLIFIAIILFTSCKKDNIPPVKNGHTITIISNGKGERVVLSTPPESLSPKTLAIKPQKDTVIFENIPKGSYMLSISRVRFLIHVPDRDTIFTFNLPNM